MKKAFTLIELVVVISIIAVLAGVVIVNTSSAQKIARDNKRKADLTTIQSTLELFQIENRKYPFIISYSLYANGCGGFADARYQLDTNFRRSVDPPLCYPPVEPKRLAPDYIQAIPTSPRGSSIYPAGGIPPSDGYYYAQPMSGNSADESRYVLCTKLENPSDIPLENKMTSTSQYFTQSTFSAAGWATISGDFCNYQVHSSGW